MGSKKNIFYLIIKRFFDIIVSIIGLILTIPIYIIIKLCYVFTGDFSSIIYAHTRVGKNGKLFKLYKFRSMVKDADKKLEEMLKKDKELAKEWKANHKLEDDPRITGIGKFIRKSSLDECPQFFNVLKGDMSLVGPRPLIEGELDEYKGNHKIYESVRPGITGWWAVNGRSCINNKQRLELEYYYCKNCGICLDIKCIIKTIGAVLCGKGAK
jgi:undecaprenyl-phosphate galactose phosphotransferase